MVYASKDDYGFTYQEGSVDCVLDVFEKRFSAKGHRERSRWKAVVEELIKKGLVETANGKDYVLTREGFSFADKHSSEFDTMRDPREYFSDGSADHIIRIKMQLEALVADRIERKFKTEHMYLQDSEGKTVQIDPYGLDDEEILFDAGFVRIQVKKKSGEVDTIHAEAIQHLPFKDIVMIDGEESCPIIHCKQSTWDLARDRIYLDQDTGEMYRESDIVKEPRV